MQSGLHEQDNSFPVVVSRTNSENILSNFCRVSHLTSLTCENVLPSRRTADAYHTSQKRSMMAKIAASTAETHNEHVPDGRQVPKPTTSLNLASPGTPGTPKRTLTVRPHTWDIQEQNRITSEFLEWRHTGDIATWTPTMSLTRSVSWRSSPS